MRSLFIMALISETLSFATIWGIEHLHKIF
jgi:hypothetical protein